MISNTADMPTNPCL